jgi:hypothetical protein
MLYSFFWVIPPCLNFVCQRFGTLSLFHLQLTFEKASRLEGDSKAGQQLHGTQHPPTKTSKETVINQSDQTLDDEVYSLLQKGLNCGVTPCTTPIEDILAGLERQFSRYHWRWHKKPGKRQ